MVVGKGTNTYFTSYPQQLYYRLYNIEDTDITSAIRFTNYRDSVQKSFRAEFDGALHFFQST